MGVDQKNQVSEASERAKMLQSMYLQHKDNSPSNLHNRSPSDMFGKDKMDYNEFAELIKRRNMPPPKKDSDPLNLMAGSSSRNNLDSLHQKPEEYDAFFIAVDRQENLLNTLKEGVVIDDQDYLIQELVANKTLFKTIYHYKFHEGLIEMGDIVSALILPTDDRLFDQRINMLELKNLLQVIGKDKSIIHVNRNSPSLTNILAPVTKVQSKDRPTEGIKINVNQLKDPFEETPYNDNFLGEKNLSKKFLDSKIGKILAKGTSQLEANEEQAMKSSILHSLRDFNSKSLVIHDRSYEVLADMSHSKAQNNQESSEELKGDQPRSFLFDFQKNVKMNVDVVKNTMKKLNSQSLKDNFEIKSRTHAGRVNFYITKKRVQTQNDLDAINKARESQKLFLSVPELLSIEYRLIDELKFKFTKAYYFETKDMEDAYFYFRVESNITTKQ